MTPMRAVALVTAIVFTAAKVVVFLCELAAAQALLDPNLSSIFNVIIHVGWVSYWALHVQENLRAHSAARAQAVLDAIHAAVEEAGDRRATEARVATLANIDSGILTGGRPPGRGGISLVD